MKNNKLLIEGNSKQRKETTTYLTSIMLCVYNWLYD